MDLWVVLLFAVAFPAYSAYSYPKVKSILLQDYPGIRVKAYVEAMFWLWLMTSFALGSWFYQQRSAEELGLELNLNLPLVLAMLLVFVVTGMLTLQAKKTYASAQQQELLKHKIENVKELLPRTQVEFKVFIGVSLTAGVCEEILYRGYLLWFLQQQGNDVLAVLMASILFGLAHSYQGIKGGLQTTAMGLLLCLLYIFSGSLWPCILLHFIYDMYAGYMGWLVLADKNGH